MNKRQKKKNLKKELIESGISDEKGYLRCFMCNEKLSATNKWQMKYGACDKYCYGRYIGAY